MSNKPNNTKSRLNDLKDILNGDAVPIEDNEPIIQPRKNNTTLTNKQLTFINEYIVDKDAQAAAIRSGYSPKGANVQGCLLLKIPEIRNNINKKLNDLAIKNGVTVEFQLQKLLTQVSRYEELMDEEFIDIDSFNSLNREWIKIMDQINKVCGFYNINILTNINQEIPLFPDVQNDDIEDIEFTNE